jgi:hypothetical protein
VTAQVCSNSVNPSERPAQVVDKNRITIFESVGARAARQTAAAGVETYWRLVALIDRIFRGVAACSRRPFDKMYYKSISY